MSSGVGYSYSATESVACGNSSVFYPIGDGQAFLCQNGTMFTQAENPITGSVTSGDAARCDNATHFYPLTDGQAFFCLNSTMLVQAETPSSKSDAFRSSTTYFQCIVAVLAVIGVTLM